MYFYIFFRQVIDNPDNFLNLLKGLSLNLVVALVLIFILTRKKISLYFFDGIAFLVFLIGFSVVFSFVLILLGYTVNNLLVANIPYTYESRGEVIFPFTFIYNEIAGNFGGIARLSGIYREPGCAPVFFCWAASYFYWRNNSYLKWFYILICIIASLATLSTVGIVGLFTLMILLCYRFKISLNYIFILSLFLMFIYFNFLYDIDYIGLKSKVDSGSGSFDERYEQSIAIFSINNLIFGDGSNWSIYSTGNINILSTSRGLGLFFLINYLCFYFMSMRNFKFFLPALAPGLLVLLFSQPFFLEPALVILLFSWMAINQIEK